MPLYRALAPVSYVNDAGTVTNIVQVGAIFSVTEAQAATIPESDIEYVGTGSNPYYAPIATFLTFDNTATFPLIGSEFHLYLAQDIGRAFRWVDDTQSYDPIVAREINGWTQSGDGFQWTSDGSPVGDPLPLSFFTSTIDGGTPDSTALVTIDGGTP